MRPEEESHDEPCREDSFVKEPEAAAVLRNRHDRHMAHGSVSAQRCVDNARSRVCIPRIVQTWGEQAERYIPAPGMASLLGHKERRWKMRIMLECGPWDSWAAVVRQEQASSFGEREAVIVGRERRSCGGWNVARTQ